MSKHHLTVPTAVGASLLLGLALAAMSRGSFPSASSLSSLLESDRASHQSEGEMVDRPTESRVELVETEAPPEASQGGSNRTGGDYYAPSVEERLHRHLTQLREERLQRMHFCVSNEAFEVFTVCIPVLIVNSMAGANAGALGEVFRTALERIEDQSLTLDGEDHDLEAVGLDCTKNRDNRMHSLHFLSDIDVSGRAYYGLRQACRAIDGVRTSDTGEHRDVRHTFRFFDDLYTGVSRDAAAYLDGLTSCLARQRDDDGQRSEPAPVSDGASTSSAATGNQGSTTITKSEEGNTIITETDGSSTTTTVVNGDVRFSTHTTGSNLLKAVKLMSGRAWDAIRRALGGSDGEPDPTNRGAAGPRGDCVAPVGSQTPSNPADGEFTPVPGDDPCGYESCHSEAMVAVMQEELQRSLRPRECDPRATPNPEGPDACFAVSVRPDEIDEATIRELICKRSGGLASTVGPDDELCSLGRLPLNPPRFLDTLDPCADPRAICF